MFVTHSPELVEQALQLRASGRPGTQIARDLGVPRGTVRDWLAGRTPRAARIGPTCPLCGEAAHRFERLPDAYVYLLGLYLGDGCISAHPRGVFRLRVVLDAAYPSIIDQAAEAIRHVRPRNAVGRRRREYNDIEVSSYSKAWPCLLPQHGPGKKHERRIVLQPWQRDLARHAPHLLVRGLIHSDGCRFVKTGRDGWRSPRYAFANLSADIRAIFVDACVQLRVRPTTSGSTIYVSRKDDVELLDAHGCAKG
jgi:hypothetical protein